MPAGGSASGRGASGGGGAANKADDLVASAINHAFAEENGEPRNMRQIEFSAKNWRGIQTQATRRLNKAKTAVKNANSPGRKEIAQQELKRAQENFIFAYKVNTGIQARIKTMKKQGQQEVKRIMREFDTYQRPAKAPSIAEVHKGDIR